MNPQLEKERARRAQALQHRLYDQQLTRLGLSNATDRPPSRSSALETIGAIAIFVLMIAVGVLALLFAPQ